MKEIGSRGDVTCLRGPFMSEFPPRSVRVVKWPQESFGSFSDDIFSKALHWLA